MIAAEAPFRYRTFQRVAGFLSRLCTQLDVQGIENVPLTGPVIISPNHIHILDVALTGTVIPRHTTILAADKWRGSLPGWVMQFVTRVIFVARGEADRTALTRSLAVLRQGQALAVAPEGTRSRSGGLQEGKEGAAYLASRSGAPIVPVAVWGHEKVFPALWRFRRVPVHIRIGGPIRVPEDARNARSAQLAEITDTVMLALAEMLPAEYRGVYAERVAQSELTGRALRALSAAVPADPTLPG